MQQLPAEIFERARDEAVEHLRALVRFDTTNPPGNERPAAKYVASVLAAEGIASEVFEPAPGRANLVARLAGSGAKQPLLLTSHLDVVPAEAARWAHEPFGGEVVDGCIWGRGTLDMKGLTAFQLATVIAVKRAGLSLERDIILLALADEEDGQALGSAWMVGNHPELIRAEFAFNEVGGFSTTVGKRRLYLVGMEEKGVCWLRLRARGETGHGAVPTQANAVARVARAVDALSRANLGSHVTPVTRAFLGNVAEAMGRPGSVIVRGLLRDSTRRAALGLMSRMRPEDTPAIRAMLRTTATPTGLSAGVSANVIPATAEATLDCRVLPGTSREAFLGRVRRVTGPDVEVEVISWGAPRSAPMESAAVEAMRTAVANGDTAGRVVPWLNVGYTDAGNLGKLGVTTYGFYPLPLPDGFPFGSLVHGDNERVPVASYQRGFGMFVDAVLGLAG